MPPRTRKSTKAAPEDHSNWPLEPTMLYALPSVARGEIAQQLLDAAEELGYPVEAVKTHTEGFVVPSKIYYHLFPSQAPEPADES